MKVRITGSPDLVKAWAKKLEDECGIHGKHYPSRKGADLRWYGDLDDRAAAELAAQYMKAE